MSELPLHNHPHVRSLTEIALNKAQKLWDDTLFNLTNLPTPDEYGQVKMHYTELRSLIKERNKLAWSNGACYMLACCNIDQNKEKTSLSGKP
jgi:hypothetical protein